MISSSGAGGKKFATLRKGEYVLSRNSTDRKSFEELLDKIEKGGVEYERTEGTYPEGGVLPQGEEDT